PCNGPVTVLGGANGAGLPDGSPVTINPDGSATAGPPVYKGVQPVPNPGNTGILIGQTLNGQLTGNYVYVPPGGTGSLPVTGSPGDGNQWGIMPMPDGTTITAPGGNQIENPDGTVNMQNGKPTFPLNGGLPIINSDNPAANNNLPPIIPDSPDWGAPGSTTAPPPVLTNGLPNIPPGYQVPNSSTGNSNPTGLPTSGAPASSNLNNGTFSQGINSIYTQDSLDTQAIVNAIKAADAANQAGHAGTSNAVNNANNTLKGMSNLLSQMASNNPATTNSSYNPDANTALANQATANGASQLQSLGDKFVIDPNSVGGVQSPFVITLPQGSWDLNPLNGGAQFSAVSTAAPWVRHLSQWAMTAWFLFWLVGEVNQAVRDATHLPQGTTVESNEPVEGSVTALIAAGVVFVAITVFIVFIGSLIVNSLVNTFLAHPFGGGGGAVVQSGIALLDAVFDIGLCVSLMAQRLALSFYLSKAYLICAGVVRFAVG
ncbi:MAG TPA: hypothetical protein VFC07_09855, partial [Verrucomicrobiae bacterium]|nr:hypothetical protein [Verrucomicrobiae bacterium]